MWFFPLIGAGVSRFVSFFFLFSSFFNDTTICEASKSEGLVSGL